MWALIGTFIHDMISLVAVPARETARAAGRLAEDFQEAAAQAANVPGVGDQLRRPFDAAANTMGGVISSANHQVTNIEQLATVVGWLVFLIPVSVVIAFGCRAASGSGSSRGLPRSSSTPTPISISSRCVPWRPSPCTCWRQSATTRSERGDPVMQR